MTSRLTTRLREIVRAPGHGTAPRRESAPDVPAAPELPDASAPDPPPIDPALPQPASDGHTRSASTASRLAEAAARTLNGDVVDTPAGPVVQVDRAYAPDHRHGLLRLGECAAHASLSAPAFPLLAGAAFDDERAGGTALFIDLETTGLAGGAGTFAFLVGCAWFEGECFRIRQYLMPGHAVERAQLAAIRAPLASCGALVSYNGRSFDVPVLETRYLYHREAPPTADRAHLDMLHVARRLWRSVRPVVAVPGLQTESCTLGALERALFGVRRTGDVPGFEIPGRYFAFLRSGDAGPLRPVLEHNRLDLISLAAVTARALKLMALAPDAAEHARECYGLARLFDRVGLSERAEACYARAAALSARSWHADEEIVRAESLRALAIVCRRAGRHADAERHWKGILELRRCPPGLTRDALEALAIHHEHRSKDLDAAHAFALRSRQMVASDDVERRLRRLERKRTRSGAPRGLWE